MRQSSSRNHRSRGWKVKHVLQVCLLVAVCVWLLYQVKHSHDKKKALEEGNLTVPDGVEETKPQFIKLGRKDLPENTVDTATEKAASHEEEENEEAEEAAEQENKQEENEEEEGRGAVDDEIDESDQERGDEEAEGGEEFGDDEEKEEQSGEVGSLENGDHEDDEEEKSQGAREENYKADDVSSAVVRDTQEFVQENGKVSAGNMDEEQRENREKDEAENDGRTNGSEVASKDEEMHDVHTNDESQLNNAVSRNDTAGREMEPEVKSLQNSTLVLESTGQVEDHSIAASNSGGLLNRHDNSTLFDPDNQTQQQTNLTETVPHEQVEARGVSTRNNAENGESTPENDAVHLDSTEDRVAVNKTSTVTENNSIAETISVEQADKYNTTQGVEESPDESHNTSSVTTGDDGAAQVEASDSSTDVSSITEEDREVRTDLSTLPDMQMDTMKEEDMAAE